MSDTSNTTDSMQFTQIGRYEIISEIGRGGMAVVYLARDPSVNRQVAVKVLPRQFTFDPMFRERFRREAEVVAALEHPCIVPMYDFGEHEEQPFIVMRHMAGGSLVDRLRQGPMQMSELEKIVDRVGSALDEAHVKNIIHRDLKPGNILFDQRGDAYLSDFGIVKMGEAGASLTGSGIIGTPAYMSPEQAQGVRDIDGRSDIYSLGIILYEMLTGQPPYAADTPMRLVVKHILEPVPMLSDVRADLPYAFQAILERALAKDVDARYQTGKMMTRDLRSAIKGGHFEDPDTEMLATPGVRPVTRGGANEAGTVPAARIGAQPTTEGAGTAAKPNRLGMWIGIGAVVLVALAAGGFLLNGVIGGGKGPTATPQVVTATIDTLAEGYAQTITAQAAILNAPTSTITPTDTPTATGTETPTPTGTREAGTPPKESPAPTRTPGATFTTAPSAQPTTLSAPTSTPAQAGGCPFSCPAGMVISPGSCSASGATCGAAVGHCETTEPEGCGIFCSPAWPGLQMNWVCSPGHDTAGNPTRSGVCYCYVIVP